jgi:DNA-binding NarL/FixJ family response regulator
VAAEVGALDPEARLLLEGAAVAGEPFAPDLATEVAELGEREGLRALDELLAGDLVRPTETPRLFAFRHPIVRRAVYDAVPAGWRLAAHGRAADALGRRGAPATAIAPHVEQSAKQGDEEAIALLLRAGSESAARAPAAAGRCFEAALRLIPAADRSRLVDVREELAGALRATGDLEGARRVLLDAVDLIDDPADPHRISLTVRCAAAERWLGRAEDARRRLLRAAELLPEDAPGATGIRIELAVGAVYDRDFDAAVEIGAEALAAARRHGTPAEAAAAAAAACLAEAVAGRIEPAREHRAEAVAFVDSVPDEELIEQIDVLYHLAWAENYLEYYEAALAHVDRLTEAIRRIDGARPLVPVMLLRCYPLETLGRLDEAAEVANDAVEASQIGGDAHFRAWALFEHAWASYYRGELGAAVASGEESMRLSERGIGGAGPSAGIGPAWVLGAALVELDEHERARELMRSLTGPGIEGAMPVERAVFCETLSLAELEGGDIDLAESYAARAEEDAAALDLGLPLGAAMRCRAALCLAAGDAATAARIAEESIAPFETIGAGIEVAYSRHLQGRALAAAGDREAAIRVLRRAESELAACGSTRERDGARRELRRLGARAEVRGPSAAGDGVDSLTERERQIAELVERRLTNREIADELVLSEKTIESHLRNVFAKLGASSRVEVARILEQHRAI